MLVSVSTGAEAAERCTLHDGKKVACPVLTDKQLEAARDAFGAEADGMGAIAVYLRAPGHIPPYPAVGAEVIPPVDSVSSPYYEAGESWSQVGQTGESGAALLFGIPAEPTRTVSFGVLASGGSLYETIHGVPVASAATTFLTVDLLGI